MEGTKTLGQVASTVSVAQIVRHGDKLTVPASMSLENAVDLLLRRMEFEEQEVTIHDTFPVYWADGANALAAVLEDIFGWSPAVPIPGFFGDKPPAMVSIEVSYGVKKQVPWGRFQLYGTDKGFIQTNKGLENGMAVFRLDAKMKRKDEHLVRRIFEAVRLYLSKNSIYRGQALRVRFRDEKGELLEEPTIRFIDTSIIRPDQLVYSREVMDSIETNLFTPIQRVREMQANDLPIKRTIMLGGVYGTGKTLAAGVASKYAVHAGVTYVYVPRADELDLALKFVRNYSDPAAVVFCEDIDRVMKGERSVKMDDLLNIIDGVDTKGSRIITVLTSNHLDRLNPAMLRAGRLDAVIEVTAPDAEAVERLIRLYGEGCIPEGMKLTRIGAKLQGHIPATIAEVVKRAKLSQLKLNGEGIIVMDISEEALLDAANSMKLQLDLLAANSAKKIEPVKMEDLVEESVHRVLTNGAGQQIVDSTITTMARAFGFEDTREKKTSG